MQWHWKKMAALFWTLVLSLNVYIVKTAIHHSSLGTRRVDLTHFLHIPKSLKVNADTADKLQFCRSGDAMYAEGRNFTENCRKCRCLGGGVKECDKPLGYSKCLNIYQPRMENTCIKWSLDGCCCVQEGCLYGNRVVDLNKTVPMDPTHPCEERLCDANTGQITTRYKVCRRQCVDAVSVEGRCCLECPTGPNCRMPMARFPYHSLPSTLPHAKFQTFLPVGDTHNASVLCHCMFPGTTASCVYARSEPDTNGTSDNVLSGSIQKQPQRPVTTIDRQSPSPIPLPPALLTKVGARSKPKPDQTDKRPRVYRGPLSNADPGSTGTYDTRPSKTYNTRPSDAIQSNSEAVESILKISKQEDSRKRDMTLGTRGSYSTLDKGLLPLANRKSQGDKDLPSRYAVASDKQQTSSDIQQPSSDKKEKSVNKEQTLPALTVTQKSRGMSLKDFVHLVPAGGIIVL